MFLDGVCLAESFLEAGDLAFDLTGALTGAFFSFPTFVVFDADAFLSVATFFAGVFLAGAFEVTGLALLLTDFLTGVEFLAELVFVTPAFFFAEATVVAFFAGAFLAGALGVAGLDLAVLDLVAEDTFFFAVMRNKFRQDRNSTKVGKHFGTTG